MKHFKVNLDRKKLTSEYIESKQNFDSVLTKVNMSKPGFWKSAWFYGTIGLSGVAAIIGYNFSQSENNLNEAIITQKNSIQHAVTSTETGNEVLIAQHVKTEEVYVVPPVEKKDKKTTDKKTGSPVKTVAADTPSDVRNNASERVVLKEKVVEKMNAPKVMSRSSMPSISGVYSGDIQWENFKQGEIFVAEDLSVKQFSIQYTSRLGDRTISVEGSKIPQDVVSDLEKLGLNQTVFITNVIAKNDNGDLMRCYSMDLNLKFK